MPRLTLSIPRTLVVLFLLMLAVPIRAIQLDSTFGSGGKFTIGFADSGLRSSVAYHVFVQPSGRIVVSGNHVSGGQFGTLGLAACGISQAGVVDTNFGSSGKTLEFIDSDNRGVEKLSNGQFLRLGFLGFQGLPLLNRMTVNGFVDSSFVADLSVGASAVPDSMVVRSDNKILVLLRGLNGDSSQWIVRLNSNGSRDTSFGNNGVLLLNLRRLGRFVIVGMHVLPDNRILLGGYLSTTQSLSGGDVAWAALLDEKGFYDRRFGLNGIARLSFSPSGISLTKTLLQPDGKIVLVGFARSATTTAQLLLIRLTTRGRRDPDFGQSGVVLAANVGPGSSDQGNSAALMSDGRIVVAGSTTASSPGLNNFLVSRFGTDGVLEGHAITPFTAGQNSTAYGVAIQSDGKAVVVGYTRNPDATTEGELFAVARYTP